MNPRPSRSSSIPIPRSASASNSARSIEALIPIPFVPPPTRHIQAGSSYSARTSTEPRRVGSSEGVRGSSSFYGRISTSPTRSYSVQSASLASSIPGRRSSSRSTYEPRVVRGTSSERVSASDLNYGPQPSTSPSQARRSSLRTSGSQKPIVPLHVVSRTTPVAFPRPTYLDHSSLRHLLQTEAPIFPIPTRKVEVPSNSSGRPHSYINSDDDDDSVVSSSPPAQNSTVARSTGFIPQDKILKLPTRWSDQDRNTHLSVSPDGRDLSYQGPSTNSEKDAAAARTLHHIPPACGIYYYEVEITAKDQKAHISIGFAGKGVKYGRLPGWEPNSWGYYGEDGTSLSADKSGSVYGQPYGGNDTIGCGIDFTTHKAFYTKNGTLVGPVFDNVGRNLDLFPSVGLQHAGDSIRANFGQEPFKYDIDYHVQQQYNATWNKISETPLDRSLLQGHRRAGFSIASITNDVSVPVLTEQESKHVLNQLVMSYLVHHGYGKTARALEYQQRVRDTNASTPTDSSDHDVEMNSSASDAVDIDIETRTSTVNAVLAGDIDTAIESLRTCYPSVLEVDDHLMLFKLRCRKFVELILETSEIKKKMKALREKEAERNKHFDEAAHEAWLEEEMNMDIDDDAAGPLVIRPILENIPEAEPEESSEIISDRYESALNAAISYGQGMSNDYQSNPRPEVQDMFRMTFGIVAWHDPEEAGGPVAELVSHNARIALAHEINQAILKSQGRPAQPALETVYRHTSTCITQLGLLGVGAAAFADMPREFFQYTG